MVQTLKACLCYISQIFSVCVQHHRLTHGKLHALHILYVEAFDILMSGCYKKRQAQERAPLWNPTSTAHRQ